MKKIFIILLIIMMMSSTCFAKLSKADKLELREIWTILRSIDWVVLDKKGEELIYRADDMLCRIEARIARIEKFQKEHGQI